jgi:uncharacterized protein
MELSGAHVLVTGATRGIGLETAREFRRLGARVSVLARDSEKLNQVARELGAHPVAADLRDLGSVARILPAAEARHGPVDVLVNNAAMMGMGAIPKLEPGVLSATLTANLLAPAELARAASASMATRRRGAIVTISSLVGEMAVRGVGAYSTSKVAIAHFTRILQRELKGTGVRTHLVFLGAVDTELIRENEADPVAGPASKRLSAIPASEADVVARRIVEMVQSGRRLPLVIPSAGFPMIVLRNLPTHLADAILAGLPRSMP